MMNKQLKEELTKNAFDLIMIQGIIWDVSYPAIITHLYCRFAAIVAKNDGVYNAVVDENLNRVIKLEEVGIHLRDVALTLTDSDDYEKAVEEVMCNLHNYIADNLKAVYINDDLLDDFEELEYKEEFVEHIIYSDFRRFFKQNYSELVNRIEDNSRLNYLLEKED